MHYVKTKNLEPGMMTTKAIYDKNRVLILASNHTLTVDTIKAIKRTRIHGLFIYDEYSDFEELDKIVDEDLRYETISNLRDFNIDQVVYFTNQIIDTMLSSKNLMIDLSALDIYDHDTYSHSIDVATMAVTCGIGLGLDNKQLSDLALSGALHDIGKQMIPQSILNKDGALTEEEMMIMKCHPQIGYNMLYNRRDISAYVRTGILSHHENWDGSGYPKGLAGEAIPLYGRILHVVDVYDALIRKRTYKGGYEFNEAIEYLMGNCGIMFDINVVKVLLKYIVVYPVGTNVKLSNGQTAHVIKNRNSSILRPMVMTPDKKVLDLANDPCYRNIVIIG